MKPVKAKDYHDSPKRKDGRTRELAVGDTYEGLILGTDMIS